MSEVTKNVEPVDQRGRPRDPNLEDRVFDAAIAIYSRGGWAAFTFGAVAETAAVGKSALYRRWGTRGQLLQDTLNARWVPLQGLDTGSLRGDLLAMGRLWFALLTGPHGGVLRHMQADIRSIAEARASAGRYGAKLIELGQEIGRRAIARDEVASAFVATLVNNAVVGGVVNHVNSTAPRNWAVMVAEGDVFVTELVELVLGGLAVRQPHFQRSKPNRIK